MPEIRLLAAADGFASRQRTIPCEFSVVENLRIVLDRGVELEASVLDEDGQPIAGADVMGAVGFRTITDEGGRFAWKHVPKDTLRVLVRKEGYKPLTFSPLKPLPETNVITLVRSAQVRAIVTDSRTGLPIESFRVTVLPEAASSYARGQKAFVRTNFVQGSLLLHTNPDAYGSRFHLLVEARDHQQWLCISSSDSIRSSPKSLTRVRAS